LDAFSYAFSYSSSDAGEFVEGVSFLQHTKLISTISCRIFISLNNKPWLGKNQLKSLCKDGIPWGFKTSTCSLPYRGSEENGRQVNLLPPGCATHFKNHLISSSSIDLDYLLN